MSKIPQIRTVMTPFPYAIEASASLAEAQAMMNEHDVRHLPVTEGSELSGVITDRDLKVYLDPTLQVPPMMRVREVMVREAYIVDLHAPLDEVLLTMARGRIGCTVVVKGDKLVGIFTTTDATRLLGEHYARQRPSDDHDAA